MNNSQKIRFAVIGCGHIGKRHAEMVKREEGAELVALCDIRPQEELGIENYPVPFLRLAHDRRCKEGIYESSDRCLRSGAARWLSKSKNLSSAGRKAASDR